jgi:hypothetical protein
MKRHSRSRKICAKDKDTGTKELGNKLQLKQLGAALYSSRTLQMQLQLGTECYCQMTILRL